MPVELAPHTISPHYDFGSAIPLPISNQGPLLEVKTQVRERKAP